MAMLEPTIREIFKRLDPELAQADLRPLAMTGVVQALRAIRLALGILRDQDLWKTKLAPDAPSLVADQFHPRIWAAASAIWDTASYRIAVEQAAITLSAHIASKAGSHRAERELVTEVFAPGDPPPGKTRLHLPGDKTSKTWRSRQDGLHLMAQGAYAGIRNVAAHHGDEWPEQLALECLAVLSVVARWADETGVIADSGRGFTRRATARPVSAKSAGLAVASRTLGQPNSSAARRSAVLADLYAPYTDATSSASLKMSSNGSPSFLADSAGPAVAMRSGGEPGVARPKPVSASPRLTWKCKAIRSHVISIAWS